jgi:hypothetical protein
MGRYIIKLGPYYLEWSTIVDAPVTYGMTLDEFTEYYQAEYGLSAMAELPERLERVNRFGCSAKDGYSIDNLMSFNRAGPNETSLDRESIYEKYCRHPDKPATPGTQR